MSDRIFKKIAGVILAAGSATRMGKTKQLLPYKHGTVLGQVVSQVIDSGIHRVFIVLGHDADKIEHSLNQQFNPSKFNIIINNNYIKGQSSSINAGISNLPDTIDSAMFLLGDQPLVTSEIINRLIRAHREADRLITLPLFKGRRGNPVIVSKNLFAELKKITGDTGARILFEKYASQIQKVDMDDHGVVLDIDTPDDYNRLTNMASIFKNKN